MKPTYLFSSTAPRYKSKHLAMLSYEAPVVWRTSRWSRPLSWLWLKGRCSKVVRCMISGGSHGKQLCLAVSCWACLALHKQPRSTKRPMKSKARGVLRSK